MMRNRSRRRFSMFKEAKRNGSGGITRLGGGTAGRMITDGVSATAGLLTAATAARGVAAAEPPAGVATVDEMTLPRGLNEAMNCSMGTCCAFDKRRIRWRLSNSSASFCSERRNKRVRN